MKLLTITVFLVIVAGLGGCATTTPESRKLAVGVSDQINDYIEQQEARVKKTNEDYRSVYDILIAEFRQVRNDRVKLRRQADARGAADRIASNWGKNTTLTAMIAELEATRDAQYADLQKRDEAISEVRKAYAENYVAIKHDLKALKAQRVQLQKLSKEKNKNSLALIAIVAKAYVDTVEKDK